MDTRDLLDPIDPLDAKLGASAPETTALTAEMRHDLRRMNRASAREASPKTSLIRRAPRLAVGISLAFALSGTAAGAAASGQFSWLPWAQDPDVAYAFTVPSGRECEIRVAFDDSDSTDNGAAFTAAVEAFTVDPAEIERIATEIRTEGLVIAINDDGTVEDKMPGSQPATEDGTYAAANYSAFGTALRGLTATTGVDVASLSEAQFQCEAAR